MAAIKKKAAKKEAVGKKPAKQKTAKQKTAKKKAAKKPAPKRYFRILCIDGGGIRGIIPACVLAQVEAEIRELRGDPTIKIGECFDLVAGTSTGGILTCLYLMPDEDDPGRARFGAEDGLSLYMEHGDEIFERSVWKRITSLNGIADEKYSHKPLEKMLFDYVGDLELSRLIRPCLVTAYETKQYRPFFFTQHDARTDPAQDFLVREVARATSAAPTYFELATPDNLDDIPNSNPMIDGGVFASNPTACALVEALSLDRGKPNMTDVVVLSLGTGRSPKSITYREAKDWGQAAWLRPLLGILMEGVSQTVDYQLETLFDSLDIGKQYLRINGVFGDHQNKLDIEGLNHDMDCATNDNMKRLERFGRQLAQNYREVIGQFVQAYF